MATYSIGKFIDLKSKVCEECGVEVIEISPKSDSASMNFWNAFTDIGMIPCSINVLPQRLSLVVEVCSSVLRQELKNF